MKRAALNGKHGRSIVVVVVVVVVVVCVCVCVCVCVREGGVLGFDLTNQTINSLKNCCEWAWIFHYYY